MKAVCFDLFDTLVIEHGAKHPQPDEVAAALHVNVQEFGDEYRACQVARNTGKLPTYVDALRRVARHLGAHVADSVLLDLQDRRERAFAEYLRTIDESVLRLLADLEAMGLTIALLSNTDSSSVAGWSSSPLAEHFSVVGFSHVIGHAKPEGRAYRWVIERLGVEPRECVFVGDGGSDELRGARDAGMVPYCAAWFIRRFEAAGTELVPKRAGTFPVLNAPADLAAELLRAMQKRHA